MFNLKFKMNYYLIDKMHVKCTSPPQMRRARRPLLDDETVLVHESNDVCRRRQLWCVANYRVHLRFEIAKCGTALNLSATGLLTPVLPAPGSTWDRLKPRVILWLILQNIFRRRTFAGKACDDLEELLSSDNKIVDKESQLLAIVKEEFKL